MNLFSTLVARNLLKHKKRACVMILGTMLTFLLLFSVLFISYSINTYNQTAAAEAYGNWHLQISNASSGFVKKLEQMQNEGKTSSLIESAAAVYHCGWASFAPETGAAYSEEELNTAFENKLLRFDQYSGQALHLIATIDERKPKGENEILLPNTVLIRRYYSVGDQITFQVGSRSALLLEHNDDYRLEDGLDERDIAVIKDEVQKADDTYYSSDLYHYEYSAVTDPRPQTYTVVGFYEKNGFIENFSDAEYTAIALQNPKNAQNSRLATAYLTLKDPSDINSSEINRLMQESNAICTKNEELLNAYGLSAKEKEFFIQSTLFVIILLTIITGAFLFFYNSFSISAAENMKNLRILSAVGSTKKQLFHTLLFEALIVSAAGILLGIFLYLFMIYPFFISALLKYVLPQIVFEEFFQNAVPPMLFCIVTFLTLLIILPAAHVPAKRMIRQSPVSDVRTPYQTPVNKALLRTPPRIQKWFGFEGMLALKNLKRNKKHYSLTVFSLICSIVLLVTVSSTALLYSGITEKNFGNIDADLLCETDVPDTGDLLSYELYGRASTALQTLKPNVNFGKLRGSSFIDFSCLSEEAKSYYYQGLKANLLIFPDSYFSELTAPMNLNPSEYLDQNTLKAIAVDMLQYYDKEKKDYVTYDLLKENTDASITLKSYDLQQNSMSLKINIGYHTDYIPQLSALFPTDALTLIIPESQYKNALAQGAHLDTTHVSTAMLFDFSGTEKSSKEIKSFMRRENIECTVHNLLADQMERNNIIFMIHIFGYAFSFILAVVVVANGFHTMLTNLNSRKQEFAVLKSIGMSSRSFRRMLWYENFFYGIKSLILGVPLSILTTAGVYFLFRTQTRISFAFSFPGLITSCLLMLAIIIITYIYAVRISVKIRITDALRSQ